jgi:hypothetical protein
MKISKPRHLRYLDLSGYAFVGKHAVIDLVREFEGYSVPPSPFEFNLLRIQGGIRDLETALSDDWSPIRSDAAVRRFRKLARRLASKNSWMNPASWFEAVGWNYDDFFKGRFTPATEAYVRGLVEATWRTELPYPAGEIGALQLFCRKLLQQLRVPSAFDFDYTLAAPDDFLSRTRDYLANLMEAFAAPGDHTVVMHNSCEPFNPSRALRYFVDGRSIIVARDPRDVFVAQNCYVPPGSNTKPAPFRAVAATPDIFCRRFRLMRKVAARAPDDPQRILRVNFEDVVHGYDASLEKIMSFLGETPATHVRAREYFKPEQSAKNIGLWRTYPDQAAIALIRSELAEFCVES